MGKATKESEKRYKVPQAKSIGESTLELHLKAHGIRFEREVYLAPGRRFKTDFLVADLAIEIDGGIWTGGRHSRGYGIIGDCEKMNILTLQGYRHLRFTTQMVERGDAINVIRKALSVDRCTSGATTPDQTQRGRA